MVHVHAGVGEEKFEATVHPIVRRGPQWGASTSHSDLVHVHAVIGEKKCDAAVAPLVRGGPKWGACQPTDSSLVHIHAGVGEKKFNTAVPPLVRRSGQWCVAIRVSKVHVHAGVGEEKYDAAVIPLVRRGVHSPSLDHGRDLVLTEPQSIIFGKLKNTKKQTVKAEYYEFESL